MRASFVDIGPDDDPLYVMPLAVTAVMAVDGGRSMVLVGGKLVATDIPVSAVLDRLDAWEPDCHHDQPA